MFSSDGVRPLSILDDLQTRFSLTPAEAEVAWALHGGAALRQIADQRAVSINTVRNQVKSAMAKTGARRQADLILLVDRQLRG